VLTAAIVWGLLTNNDDDDDDGGPLYNLYFCTRDRKWLGGIRPCSNRRKHYQWSWAPARADCTTFFSDIDICLLTMNIWYKTATDTNRAFAWIVTVR
jgi:hypothetical protein